MLQKIERQIFMEDAPGRIHHLERPDYASATGLAKQVIDQMASEYLVAPPVTLHFVQPRLMAGVWAMVRESLVAGGLDRPRRGNEHLSRTIHRPFIPKACVCVAQRASNHGRACRRGCSRRCV